ncbi:CDK5 regulatory subunit-associated protein 2-like [Notolabrus celidotus]|uniref:CDK5 regulatory subunit-associated protein 2-like n=1 Tax=Notolabrus celidotus TaxID=1203425 RepID=UPI00148F5B05|nr:CDK5 regulatory subunit-associated protein 2-like [Notolabrus celidotus]
MIKAKAFMDWSSSPPEQTWGESESAAEEQTSSKLTDHMTDLCSDETDNSPPLKLHTLKQFEQHLNDLKKENFSLKLRIYFLEERIQQKYEESSEDVYRTNIELKVEVESLKQELHEKQQFLDKALSCVLQQLIEIKHHTQTFIDVKCNPSSSAI